MNSIMYLLQNKDQFINRLQQIKSQFSGDPNQKIQEMLNSGRITQDDYNKAVERAKEIRRLFGI